MKKDNIFQFLRGKNIKAILLDMDGTLFDSESGSINMMKELALKHRNIKSNIPFEELTGLGYPEKLEKILGYKDPELLDIVLIEGSKLYSQIAEPIKGVEKALQKLKANNLKLAVCTNGDINFSKPVFKKIDIQMDLFQGTKGMNKKPAPDVFLAALKHFNISASQAIVIEDSQIGIKGAQNAGIPNENILIFDVIEAFDSKEQKFQSWEDFLIDERKFLRK